MRLLLIIGCLITIESSAQTKEIAYKSHSGNMEFFKVAMEHRMFNADDANFGLPPEKKTYKLDSVIYISDTSVILVTKTYSRMFNEPADSARLVRTGKDTIYKDPLFTRKHSLDSIRNILKKNKQYINPINKIIFIGFDNKRSKTIEKWNQADSSKRNNLLPVAYKNEEGNRPVDPFDRQLIPIVIFILMISIAGGWLSWKLYRPQLQNA